MFRWLRWFVWIIEVTVAAAAAVFLIHWRVYSGKVIPRVSVSGIELSGLTKKEAEQRLEMGFLENPGKISLEYEGKIVSELKDLQIKYDFEWTVSQAMGVGRNGNFLTQAKERLFSLVRPLNLEPAINYDRDELMSLVGVAGEKIRQEFVPPRIGLGTTGKPEFLPGRDSVEADEESLTNLLIKAVAMPGDRLIEIPVKKMPAAFNDESVNRALLLADKWIGKTMVLEYESYKKTLSSEEIFGLLGVFNSALNEQAINELGNLLENKINREAENAVFRFEKEKVVEFKADQKGVRLDRNKLNGFIEKGLAEQTEKIVLPVILTEPKIKAGEVNNLGIKELLGRGESKFAHSIPSRVFNVALAAKRINHVLIPPGEIFSFNKEIGEISSATGYRSAYVIKDGRTVLGDGGGTCQVSTTMFRAAMKAGLPIVERKAHSYRVSYYEQDSGPGIDATVYAPSADLKFLNDTPEYILIQTTVDTKNLTIQIEIFGTSDGRTASISKPVIYSQSPPPEPLYEDDPTLPVGVVKQIDWAAWGARTSFNYKVERNGEVIIEKTFYSNFRPWQAVYLRGVGK